MKDHAPSAKSLTSQQVAYVKDTVVPELPNRGGYGVIHAGQNAGEAVAQLDLEFTDFSEKAEIAAEVKRRLDAAMGIISEDQPRNAYEMLERQNQLVHKMNILTNPNNQ